MSANGDVDWQEKFVKQQETLRILSGHCQKVVEKHDDIVNKFKENNKQYNIVVVRLEEREKQLLHIRKLLEPVYTEYATLKEKYEIEQGCRQEAEKYASEITRENRVLKRQSQAFLDQNDGKVPVEDEQDTFKKYLDTLNTKITELEEEKATLSATLQQQNEDYEILKDNYSNLSNKYAIATEELQSYKETVVSYKESLKQVTTVSEAAYQEYENLKKEYEMATACQSTAETFATEMYAQSEAMKRQSAVLLSSAMSDDRLMNSLQEVETLTQELETIKKQHAQKIVELEREIKELKDEDTINTLESDNEALHEERDQLTNQLTLLQTQYSTIDKQYKTLEKQYSELEKKYDTILHPPPPPPPPLPPISMMKNKGFLSRSQSKRIKERQKKLNAGGAKPDENYSMAINEMMNRIKQIKQGGLSLRPVLKPTGRRPSCPDENSGAMEELHSMLHKMKRNRSVGDLMNIDEDTENNMPESELKTMFHKIKKVASNDEVTQ